MDTHNDTELLLDVTRVGVDGVLFAPGSESSAKLQQQIAQIDAPLVILDRDIAPDRPGVKVDHDQKAKLRSLGLAAGYRALPSHGITVEVSPPRHIATAPAPGRPSLVLCCRVV